MSQTRIVLTNQFLIAMPGMLDEGFKGAVIYMCEHNENGALGLVINRPMAMTLGNLFEKVDLSPPKDELAGRPVFYGGPVQPERGFVLHAPLDAAGNHYNATMIVPGGLEMTTSRDVLEALSNGAGPKRVFVTLGYSGWAAGQLEEEIGRNGWLTVEASHEIIFDTPVELRYERALGLLGVDPRMLSQEAGHA
jgi:putative transcriptional regulator